MRTATTTSRKSGPGVPQTRRHRTILEALSLSQQQLIQEAYDSPLDYVANSMFRRVSAERDLFDQGMVIAHKSTGWYHPMLDDDVTGSTAPSSSLLKTEEEKHLFLRYNYARMKVRQFALRFRTHPGLKVARELARWERRALDARELITHANLALVLAMAKRTRMTDVDFGELISEGNMALLRAVEKFDAARGFKFSTYACRAILKAFSRIAVKTSRYRNFFPAEFDVSMERSNDVEVRRQNEAVDAAEDLQRIIHDNSAQLTDVERRVIEARFALNHDEGTQEMTLEEVGSVIGVTKERVRQIQNRALEKLRATLDHEIHRG
ncbi:MAG TPA: sigma-70 family RNA polymerase sigma factor [Phycisphaerae bacterium]|nr:sigma-70 family RNA polymerase sigma factor [Phycisphaerae bacterium]